MSDELTTYSVLPPDFRLQTFTDKDGIVTTNKMGLEGFGFHRSYRYDNKFFNTLTGELLKLFVEEYNCCVNDVRVLSMFDSENGSTVMWLRTKKPVNPRVKAIETPKPRVALPAPKHDEDVIDI